MIIEYKVVRDSEQGIEAAVNQAISQGWQPYGTPTFMTRGLSGQTLEVFQAMVKEESNGPGEP